MRYRLSTVALVATAVLCGAAAGGLSPANAQTGPYVAPKRPQGTTPETSIDPKLLLRMHRDAERFSRRPELAQAVDRTCLDKKLHSEVLADPNKLLKMANLSLPKGLAFDVFAPASPGKVIDAPFVFELTHCRVVYVWECDDSSTTISKQRACELKKEEICLGFRIRPVIHWPPVGPIPPIGPKPG